MKQQEIFLLTAIGLLVSSKDVLASENFDRVKIATLNRDSNLNETWIISRVISLPPINLNQKVPTAKLSESIPPQNRTYRISPGDTLESLAGKFQITVSQLASSNGIKNPNYIFVGQTLVIPNSKESSNNEKSVRPVVTTSTTEKIEEINVTALVERQKNRPLPLPPRPITRKNFSSSSAASSLQMGKLGAPSTQSAKSLSTRPLKANTGGLSRQVATARLHESKKILGQKTEMMRRLRPADRLPTGKSRFPSRAELVFVAPTAFDSRFPHQQNQQITPELPPLSVPDEYLPNAPMNFTGYIWPSNGTLTSGYGWRWGRMHKGVDIANAIGTPVVAAAAGEVIAAGWNDGGYGNLVKLKHADGSVTLYAHNSRILVYEGKKVEQGELIAQMGSTGYSTGPHLHFEIHPSRQGAVNPIAFLPPKR